MKAFMEWMRKRFSMVDMMHLTDIEDETLKIMLFQNGQSRDEFIRFLVKLLLDIDLEDSKNHNLEKIFVSFGLLDKDAAQQFITGNMPTNLHMATWKRIIDALIPTTTITPQLNSYDEQVNYILSKTTYFRSVAKKNYLPPELIPKLKDQNISTENGETVEEIANDLVKIIKKPIKPDGNNDVEHISNSEEKTNNLTSEFMDVTSIKKEIDQYVQILNDTKLLSTINNDNSVRMSPQEFLERTKQLDIVPVGFIESKIENIYKLMKADHDLKILADSLANQPMLDSQLSQ